MGDSDKKMKKIVKDNQKSMREKYKKFLSKMESKIVPIFI